MNPPDSIKQVWQIRAFAGLVAADILSKSISYLLLDPNQELRAQALLQLVLRVNPVGLGSAAQKAAVFSHSTYQELAFVPTLFGFGLGALLLGLSCWRKLSAKTVALSVVGMMIVACVVTLSVPEAAFLSRPRIDCCTTPRRELLVGHHLDALLGKILESWGAPFRRCRNGQLHFLSIPSAWSDRFPVVDAS
jgi:hypothetical protein